MAADLKPDGRRSKGEATSEAVKSATDYLPRRAESLVSEALSDTRVVTSVDADRAQADPSPWLDRLRPYPSAVAETIERLETHSHITDPVHPQPAPG